jgi:hypothetical protein
MIEQEFVYTISAVMTFVYLIIASITFGFYKYKYLFVIFMNWLTFLVLSSLIVGVLEIQAGGL